MQLIHRQGPGCRRGRVRPAAEAVGAGVGRRPEPVKDDESQQAADGYVRDDQLIVIFN